MTLLLPIPRAVAFHALGDAADRLRLLLFAFLVRTPSRARHRLLSPGQIRWRRWKSELADYVATGLVDLPTGSVPRPRPPVRAYREASRTPAWGALDPPPRTAQRHDPVPAPVPADDLRRPDEAPPTDCALPTGGAHHRSTAEPEEWIGVWPEASPEPWGEPQAESWPASWAEPRSEACAEPWSEPWSGARSEPSSEPWVEHADTFFAGRIEETAYANPMIGRTEAGRHARWPGVSESPDAWPAFTERVFAHAAVPDEVAEPADAEPAHAEPDDAETTVVEPLWEFQVGDLARWWDESMARLDAVARGEVGDRPW